MRKIIAVAALLCSVFAPRSYAMPYLDLPKFQQAVFSTWGGNSWTAAGLLNPYYTGNRLDSLHFDRTVGATTLPFQYIVIQYNSSGQAVGSTTRQYNGQTWSVSEIDSFVYDASGKLIEQFESYYSNGSLQTYQRITNTYSGSQVISGLQEQWKNNAWTTDVSQAFSYNALGQRTQKLTTSWTGSTWVNKQRDTWSYGANNALTDIVFERVISGAYTNENKLTFTGTTGPAGTGILTLSSIRAFDTLVMARQVQRLTVTNTGTGTVTIPRYDLTNGLGFTLSDTTTHSLAPGQSSYVTIAFLPDRRGVFSDTLHVYESDGTIMTIPFIGHGRQGLLAVSKDTTKLGTTTVGGSATTPVTFSNVGDADLTVTSIGVRGSSEFSMTGSQSGVLAPGGLLTIQVMYNPIDLGSDTMFLTVHFSDGSRSYDSTVVVLGVSASLAVSSAVTPGEVICYPNPSRGIFRLSNPSRVNSIQIINAEGLVVADPQLVGTGEVDISNVTAGSYVLRILYRDGSATLQRVTILH